MMCCNASFVLLAEDPNALRATMASLLKCCFMNGDDRKQQPPLSWAYDH